MDSLAPRVLVAMASLGIESYEMILSPLESIKYKICPACIHCQNDAIIIYTHWLSFEVRDAI